MTATSSQVTGQSIRHRLFNLSKERGEDFQVVLRMFAIERLLYRMNVSEHSDQFILKGAMLFYLWDEKMHRPTRDLDLLGAGEISVARLESMFREISQVNVENDALVYDQESVRGLEIREDQEYQGIRIQVTAYLHNVRIPLQIDIGFGDPVIPAPESAAYPTLLNFSSPELQVYPRYTMVAEKFQIMVRFGIANSRMKDFYDIWFLARRFPFQGESLSEAINATFRRRRTPLPEDAPLALTSEFADDPTKQSQWNAFIQRGVLEQEVPALDNVVDFLQEFVMPPTRAVVRDVKFTLIWQPFGPWK